MTEQTDSSPPDEQIQNNALENSEQYDRCMELAQAGKFQQALDCMQEYLRTAGENAQVLNDTGAILHCLGRSDEAINQLVKARNLQPDSAEIIWNLSETYLAVDKAKQAMELFDDMERMGILNADVLNRTANIFLSENNLSDAVKMLNWSLELCPDQEILQPMIEVICQKMTENNCE